MRSGLKASATLVATSEIDMIFPSLATDPEWVADCLKYRGIVLTGVYSHWCFDWDGLPIDEYCEREWPCACVRALLTELYVQEAIHAALDSLGMVRSLLLSDPPQEPPCPTW